MSWKLEGPPWCHFWPSLNSFRWWSTKSFSVYSECGGQVSVDLATAMVALLWQPLAVVEPSSYKNHRMLSVHTDPLRSKIGSPSMVSSPVMQVTVRNCDHSMWLSLFMQSRLGFFFFKLFIYYYLSSQNLDYIRSFSKQDIRYNKSLIILILSQSKSWQPNTIRKIGLSWSRWDVDLKVQLGVWLFERELFSGNCFLAFRCLKNEN